MAKLASWQVAKLALSSHIAPQKAVIAETREEVDADEAKLNTVHDFLKQNKLKNTVHDPRKVPKEAIRLARKSHRKVTENVSVSLSLKLIRWCLRLKSKRMVVRQWNVR